MRRHRYDAVLMNTEESTAKILTNRYSGGTIRISHNNCCLNLGKSAGRYKGAFLWQKLRYTLKNCSVHPRSLPPRSVRFWWEPQLQALSLSITAISSSLT